MIQRDSLHESLWQDFAENFVASRATNPDKVYDVIVVGGGITGIATAHRLQDAGRSVLLIEAGGLCYGTTGGTTAHLNTLVDTPYNTIRKDFGKDGARMVAMATAEAIQLIKENANKYAIDCDFKEEPGYLYSSNEKQDKELDDIVEASREAGLLLNFTPILPVPDNFIRAVRVERQASFNPVKYVFGLAAAFERAGGTILQNTRVTGVEENKPLEVNTTSGVYKANDMVYATHIPIGINLLHMRCAPYRSYAMAVKLPDDQYPEALVYDMEDPYNYYRTQDTADGRVLIIGGADHKTGHEPDTQNCYRDLESKLRSLYPGAKITHRWSSQLFEPADGLPYIGHLPQHSDHIYVATGFSGNGMVYSHVAAISISRQIVNGTAAYDNIFNPRRLKPVAGFASFIKFNADVAKEFLGKLFDAEKLDAFSDIAPGEGKIVKLDGQKMGLYKSEDGRFYAVNPVCTHMKCDVSFNKSEKSWDCPCHGGRFDCHGKLLTGPPSADLEEISIQQLVENR